MVQLTVQAVISVILLINRVLPCLEQTLSKSDWTSSDEIGDYRIRGREDENTTLLIMKDFVFTCQGSITQWKLQWHYRDGLSGCIIHFHFYVMRQSEDCGNVIIAGENHFTETINQNGDSTILTVDRVFSVLPEHQLQVQEEDFIGVAVTLGSQCSDTRLWVAGRNGVQNTVRHGVFSSLNNAMSTLSRICTSLELYTSIAPFVTVTTDMNENNGEGTEHTTISGPSEMPSTHPSHQPTQESSAVSTTTSNNNVTSCMNNSSNILGLDPSNTSNGASISPNRAKVEKHSHRVQFVSTTYTVRAAPQSIRVNKNVTTFQSGLPQIHFSSHYEIVTFTEVNNSLISSDQFILIVVGASAGALFLLGFIVTVTLLCLWRCLHVHIKDESPGNEPSEADKHDMDYNAVYSSCVYDSPASVHKVNVEADTHIYDVPESPPHHQRTNGVNLAQTQLPVPGPATCNPNSLSQGQGYMMTINKAYASA